MLLSCTIEGVTCSEERALNDIVVARGTLSRMAQYEVFINDELYATFKGDGVIISTPVGSTAYSFFSWRPTYNARFTNSINSPYMSSYT